MAAHGAYRLLRMLDNLHVILGVELLCAAQGIEFRAPLATSAPLQACLGRLRAEVPALTLDRYLAPDIAKAAQLTASGEVASLSRVAMPRVAP